MKIWKVAKWHIIWILIAVALLLHNARNLYLEYEFSKYYQETIGQITSVSGRLNARKAKTRRYVNFAYSIPNKTITYKGRKRITRSEYIEYKKSSDKKIKVYYLPSKPTFCKINEPDARSEAAEIDIAKGNVNIKMHISGFTIINIPLLLLFIGLVLRRMKYALNYSLWKDSSKKERAAARILKVWKMQSKKNDAEQKIFLRYEFITTKGKKIIATKEVAPKRAYQEGETIEIAYALFNPKKFHEVIS